MCHMGVLERHNMYLSSFGDNLGVFYKAYNTVLLILVPKKRRKKDLCVKRNHLSAKLQYTLQEKVLKRDVIRCSNPNKSHPRNGFWKNKIQTNWDKNTFAWIHFYSRFRTSNSYVVDNRKTKMCQTAA